MIKPAHCARDLGVWLDPNLSMKHHVKKTTSSALSYLRVISRQRHFLNNQSTSLLLHSLVFTRLDYCSSLLYGINESELSKLQSIINYASRVLMKLKKTDDISQVTKTLKWPSMKQKIKHRICCLVYKILRTGESLPLRNLFKLCSSLVNTRRTADPLLLSVPAVKTAFGERSFQRCGARMWNSLSTEVRSLNNYNHLICVSKG